VARLADASLGDEGKYAGVDMGLQQFEQRLERLVEGAFAKALKGELQPVEIGRRLTARWTCNEASRPRIVAPNSFEIGLSAVDFDRFGACRRSGRSWSMRQRTREVGEIHLRRANRGGNRAAHESLA